MMLIEEIEKRLEDFDNDNSFIKYILRGCRIKIRKYEKIDWEATA
jgi:hypothetical protein